MYKKIRNQVAKRDGRFALLVLTGAFLLAFGVVFYALASEASGVLEYVLSALGAVIFASCTFDFWAEILVLLLLPVFALIAFMRTLLGEPAPEQDEQPKSAASPSGSAPQNTRNTLDKQAAK